MPHTWLGIFIIRSWQSPSQVDILSTFHRQVWVSELLTQRHGPTMWWSWSGNWNLCMAQRRLNSLGPHLDCKPLMERSRGFFLRSFLVSACSGFPIKVVAGHEQQGECYKNRVWYKWTESVRVSSLRNHKPGTRVNRLLLSWLNIILFLKILQRCLLLCVCFVLFLNFYSYFILLYNTVLVLPYIDMNPPQVYMSSQSWTPLPPPTPYHLSGSSPCT